MSSRYWDIKPGTSNNALEDWKLWLNRMQSDLISLPYYRKKKIKVVIA